MNFDWSEEQQAFRTTVREFLAANLKNPNQAAENPNDPGDPQDQAY